MGKILDTILCLVYSVLIALNFNFLLVSLDKGNFADASWGFGAMIFIVLLALKVIIDK